MGAKYCEEELPSNNFALASTDDRRFSKHIHDNVHGNIYIDPLSLKFVDTEQFQRSHEEMSLKMIDHVVDEHNIDIDSESLTRVKEMIIASENGTSKAIELMFVDAMTKANDVLCISSYIDEPAEYWKVEAVSEAFENFQLKTYGKKAQVHATPEKKKRKRLRYISGAV
ncbi:UNVERIFIED_CONTAM: hypothetical protein Sradi_4827200 [Sesamum radiatum]|uniref:Uncharacterized protein n=1 Tax=Sesamum radiatum TaxID=300843 RepID=A0AAW2MYY3_SESRA